MKQFVCVAAAFLATEIQAMSTTVTVREGPTDCEDNEKIQNGKYVKLHFTGTIDESSPTGEKGKEFDSSRNEEDTFNF